MHALTRTARMTGLFYLGNALAGVLGFLIVRPQLFAADDPSTGRSAANRSHAGAGGELKHCFAFDTAVVVGCGHQRSEEIDRKWKTRC